MIYSATNAAYLKRIPAYLDPSNDWTYRWSWHVNTPTQSVYRVGLLLENGVIGSYDAPWIEVFIGDNLAQIILAIDDGSGIELDTVPVSISYGIVLNCYLLYNSNLQTIQLLVNEVDCGTLTCDLSVASPFAIESLLSDALPTNTRTAVSFARVWQNLLTAPERAAEDASITSAVKTTGLLADSPLIVRTNLADNVVTNPNWTEIGTLQYLPLAADPAYAIDIGSTLPYNSTQETNFFPLWLKYTGQAGDTVIGAWILGNLSTFQPTTIIFGPDSTVTSFIVTGVANVPTQFPVNGGEVWYINLVPPFSASTSVATISVLRHTTSIISSEVIFVPDDTEGFPLALLSIADATAAKFVKDFPAGESAFNLVDGNGNILTEDISINGVKLYSANLELIRSIPSIKTTPGTELRITSNKVDIFYVGDPKAVASRILIYDGNGILTDTQTLPDAGIQDIAVNSTETILYIIGQGGSTNTPVKRWDLVNEVMLTDLVAGVGANYAATAMLCLDDDTVLVSYRRNSPEDNIIKHYSAAGATLNTYTLATGVDFHFPTKLAHALDNPTSFWTWIHLTTGFSNFINIKVSDGSVLTTLSAVQYEAGQYNGVATLTPARYGHSASCPFLILEFSPIVGGMYVIEVGSRKTNDTLYTGSGADTEDVKIPDPFGAGSYIGDE